MSEIITTQEVEVCPDDDRDVNASGMHVEAEDTKKPSGNTLNSISTNEATVLRRSVYVGNVDYGSTPQELEEHFKDCGKILRITIMTDRFTGKPKGFGYIEFSEPSGAMNAIKLNSSVFRERELKISPKRQNIMGFNGAVNSGMMCYASPYGRPAVRGRGRSRHFSEPY